MREAGFKVLDVAFAFSWRQHTRAIAKIALQRPLPLLLGLKTRHRRGRRLFGVEIRTDKGREWQREKVGEEERED